ncbi:hypothetical protein AB1L42_23605 [Thalassoglobus sp. JC818]|uniref:hypothetical protein n=1 Tax=Thalassoglobus sp. JC818 TaxID=3232136 RepID=UPI00345A1D70
MNASSGKLFIARSEIASAGAIAAIDLESQEVEWTAEVLGGVITGVAVTGGLQRLVVAGHDGESDWGAGGEIKMLDSSTGEIVWEDSQLLSLPVSVISSRESWMVLFHDGTLLAFDQQDPTDGGAPVIASSPIADQIDFVATSEETVWAWSEVNQQFVVVDWSERSCKFVPCTDRIISCFGVRSNSEVWISDEERTTCLRLDNNTLQEDKRFKFGVKEIACGEKLVVGTDRRSVTVLLDLVSTAETR